MDDFLFNIGSVSCQRGFVCSHIRITNRWKFAADDVKKFRPGFFDSRDFGYSWIYSGKTARHKQAREVFDFCIDDALGFAALCSSILLEDTLQPDDFFRQLHCSKRAFGQNN